MNDSELRSLLRSARPPDRDPEYWRDFPARVARLTERRRFQVLPEPRGASFFWSATVAMACLVIGFFIGRHDRPLAAELLVPEQTLRGEWKAVPDRLCVIMQDEHGLHRLAEEDLK